MLICEYIYGEGSYLKYGKPVFKDLTRYVLDERCGFREERHF